MGQLHIIPDFKNLNHSLSVADKWNAAFEYNDFFMPDILDDTEGLQKRIREYRSLLRERSKDTLHGAFFDLSVNSQDKKIAEVSRMRMRQSMEIAAALDVRAVIFHTNAISGFSIKGYEEHWLDCHEDFIKQLMHEYQGIVIYMENMFDRSPELLGKLSERLLGTGFGVCLDVAHANITETPIEVWFERLAPYIRHMHVNDNDGVTDLHQVVGTGKMDWQLYQSLIEKFQINSSVLVEVASLEGAEKSLQYIEEKGIYPFA